jgi:hypothetical protein
MAVNSDSMLDTLSTVTGDVPIVQDECKRNISVLDTAKIPYANATKNLDRALHNLITPVNDTLYATRDAYDERIDVQECRTDLFWRLTGITSVADPADDTIQYTFTCTKLSTMYGKTEGASGLTTVTTGAEPGFSTNTVTYYDGTTFNNINLPEEGDLLNGVGSFFDSFYEPDNLHGYKLYDEPYAKDTFDTFRGVGVGTIGIGTLASTNRMTILNPDIQIEVGQIATPSQPGYFATQSATVTGVGTTAVDLSTYPFTGIATSKLQVVPYITLDQLPIVGFDAPLSDGSFVDILFSQDPSTISDSLAISIDTSPYSDQTIEIMSYNRAGVGVSVYYTNSGIASGTRSWNKFMNGLPDPDTEDPEDMDTKISEPPIGADKIYYRVGFPNKPVSGGSDASEGDTIIVDKDLVASTTLYSSLSACNDTALNAAILTRNNSETALASNPARDGMAEASNQIKTKVNDEFNLRIWAYRTQIGESNSRLAGYNSFKDLMENSPYRDIINGGSSDD